MSRLLYIVVLLFNLTADAAPDFSPVRRLLEEAVADGKVAGGSVLVLHRGEVVFKEGFGFADLKSRTPFRVQTPVVIASISKPLLGTAAFRLSEQGKLNLAAPISEYLPEFASQTLESGVPLSRAPSTIELFTHTSGMRNSEAPGGRPWFASWTEGKPLAEVVKRYALEFRFKAQPGARYAYSGIGTDVAARVLEVAAARPRNALLVAEVAKPLGMTHTFYRDAESLKRVGPMPTRYYHGKDGQLLVSRLRPVPPKNTYSSSGGSIISTSPDLARWLLMIRNNGRHEGKPFLAPETLADMLAGFPPSKNSRGGLFIRKKNDTGKAMVVGHTGSSGTNCWIDFEHDMIGIMLTQTRGKDIEPFRYELEKRINECIAE
jgi:CubicO group peptidase (beta-lactamase class C family)